MAEYLIKEETLKSIAEAVRSKSGKTNLIQLNDMPSEINAIETGAELNFELKAYSTEEDLMADLPKENTIGIITETPFENWTFSYAEPSGTFENGHIWVKTALSSIGEFNAIKNNDIRIYPSSLFQYIDGSWVSKSGRIYKTPIGWNGFGVIPEFTYTGSYQIVDDNDAVITESLRDWKVRFLSSGKLVFTNLNNAINGIDIFLCGGGAGGVANGGGGGGYTKTSLNYKVSAGIEYDVVVGAGGKAGAKGGASSFGNYDGTFTANGGNIGESLYGGSGGSGGGAGAGDVNAAGAGGSNGSNGGNSRGGSGQGTTTREFAESTGKLYAGGGGGASWQGTNGAGGAGGGGAGGRYNTGLSGKSGTNYLGGGGGGKNGNSAGAGGTGIVIIRNKRG